MRNEFVRTVGRSRQTVFFRPKSIQNPDEPVQVLIIGVGPDVNASDLNQITAVTGGAVFLATDPSLIGDIFLRALALPAGQ